MNTQRVILQIMPADEWGARYVEPQNNGQGPAASEMVWPLSGWALVREGEQTAVVGLVADRQVEFADALPNFAGYLNLAEQYGDDFDPDGFFDLDDDFDESEADDLPPSGGRPTRLN